MNEQPNGRGALFAGGLAALLASTCCLGPLAGDENAGYPSSVKR